MSEEEDERPTPPTPDAKPKRVRTRKPPETKRLTRFERRAESAKTTLRELIRLRKPDLDVEGLSFLEVVDRDADAWGRFLAQLSEWVVPFGQLVDLAFGAPLLALVGLAPSVRAARRDLRDRRIVKQQQAEAARFEAEQAREGMPTE